MTKLEKCEYLIQKGYTCNPETGEVFNRFGKELKCTDILGYKTIGTTKLRLYQHIFMWYWVNRVVVDCLDHINRIKSDNRIVNLRSVTYQENHFNLNCKGYTIIKKTGKYKAQIRIDGKQIYIGHYKTEEEAKNAYITAKEKYHIINWIQD